MFAFLPFIIVSLLSVLFLYFSIYSCLCSFHHYFLSFSFNPLFLYLLIFAFVPFIILSFLSVLFINSCLSFFPLFFFYQPALFLYLRLSAFFFLSSSSPSITASTLSTPQFYFYYPNYCSFRHPIASTSFIPLSHYLVFYLRSFHLHNFLSTLCTFQAPFYSPKYCSFRHSIVPTNFIALSFFFFYLFLSLHSFHHLLSHLHCLPFCCYSSCTVLFVFLLYLPV